nr:MAG TPA: hypothetical protein [Bacteriophage sp.]
MSIEETGVKIDPFRGIKVLLWALRMRGGEGALFKRK